MEQIYTVSQINGYLKDLLDDDIQMKSIFLRGEISNFTHHLKTGHFYFTLKDQKSSIKGIMFRSYTQNLRFLPQNGMNVVLFGSVRFFERDGICQFYCVDMQPDGVGAVYLAFEQLKDRLEREGLFDPAHKKPLPPFPKRIGVVTAKTGAALQDIIHILTRRYPLGELVLIPALVQGEKAPESICGAINQAADADLDVLIVGRGGGSLEDLWAFNDERVAKAIYRCKIPVISAVGHETDYTIADFVADLRAPTPSAAAELAAPDILSLQAGITGLKDSLNYFIRKTLADKQKEAKALSGALFKTSPITAVEALEGRCNLYKKRLAKLMGQIVEQKNLTFLKSAASLEALSPLKVLSRGYSITDKKEKIIDSVRQIAPGDRIRTRLTDGTLISIVEEIRPQEAGQIKDDE